MQQPRVRVFHPGDHRRTRLAVHLISLLLGLVFASLNIFAAGATMDTIVLYLITALAPYLVSILLTLRSRVLFTIVFPPLATFIIQVMLQFMYYTEISQGGGLAYQPYLYTIMLTVPQAAIATGLSALIAYIVRKIQARK